MPLIAKQSEGSRMEPVEAGTHQAVCYGVIDLGTQIIDWKGQSKYLRKVLISWELPSVRIDYEKDDEVKNVPRVISKMYTLSLSEKSNLYKDLLSWRGKPFSAEELVGFDIFKILGANCILQVVHTERNGNVYADVAAITGLVKGLRKYEPENDTIRYSMADDGSLIPEGLPDWVINIIRKSEEYRMVSKNQDNSKLKAAQEMYGGGIPEEENENEQYLDDDDSIPF